MTTQVLFNQLAYIDRLTRGGFPPDQARASAEALEFAFTESVATKSDLERGIASLESKIAATEARLELKIADVRGEVTSVRGEIASVRGEIAQAKNETLRWVFGFNLVLIGAIFAIVKYVH